MINFLGSYLVLIEWGKSHLCGGAPTCLTFAVVERDVESQLEYYICAQRVILGV